MPEERIELLDVALEGKVERIGFEESCGLGYTIRQSAALRRFHDDGRLPMSNNASERALRSIAKWVGSLQ